LPHPNARVAHARVNLYLRLLWALLRAWRQPRLEPGDTLVREFRVLPNDLDVNGHMNNGRYLTMLDLMLVEYFVRTGFARVLVQQGWRPISGGAFISYRRALDPLQRYTLRYRLDACDTHWNYLRFEFSRGERVHAAGYMKGTAVSRDGLVPNATSYSRLGRAVLEAPLPEAVQQWLGAERCVMQSPFDRTAETSG
jgi:acyl-CoA thioesterase FadM